jgi:hypothetical protein
MRKKKKKKKKEPLVSILPGNRATKADMGTWEATQKEKDSCRSNDFLMHKSWDKPFQLDKHSSWEQQG